MSMKEGSVHETVILEHKIVSHLRTALPFRRPYRLLKSPYNKATIVVWGVYLKGSYESPDTIILA